MLAQSNIEGAPHWADEGGRASYWESIGGRIIPWRAPPFAGGSNDPHWHDENRPKKWAAFEIGTIAFVGFAMHQWLLKYLLS